MCWIRFLDRERQGWRPIYTHVASLGLSLSQSTLKLRGAGWLNILLHSRRLIFRSGARRLSEFRVMPPSLQLGFYQRLKAAEKVYLLPALLQHIVTLSVGQLDQELLHYAHDEKLAARLK